MLELEPMRDQAAKEAIAAEMVIISAQWAVDLPAPVRRWLENWSPCKRGRFSALVALLNPKAPATRHPRPLCSYLRNTAAQGGMDFFTNEELPPSPRLRDAGMPVAAWPESRRFDGDDRLGLDFAVREGGIHD